MIAAVSVNAHIPVGCIHCAQIISGDAIEDILENARIIATVRAREWGKSFASVQNISLHIVCENGDAWRQVLTDQGFIFASDEYLTNQNKLTALLTTEPTP